VKIILIVLSVAMTSCVNTASIKFSDAKTYKFTGKDVTWNGRIINIDNQQNQTIIEIMALKNCYAKTESNNIGRFLAIFKGFKDPNIYSPDEIITITGKISEPQTKLIGGYKYKYPVIQVTNSDIKPKVVNYNYYPPHWNYVTNRPNVVF